MIKKLNIKNGIIQDGDIAGIPFKAKIVKPSGNNNVLTNTPMVSPIGVTVHNTANIRPTADAMAHAKNLQRIEIADKGYIGVHFFIDEKQIVQSIPLNMVTWHAGDGVDGTGNLKTISIEICENGDLEKATKNAMVLVASLINTYPNLKIYKHQDWSGKYCPRRILDQPNGWENFKRGVKNMLKIKKHWGLKHLENLVKKGIIKNPEAHKDSLDEHFTKAEILALIDRITDK